MNYLEPVQMEGVKPSKCGFQPAGMYLLSNTKKKNNLLWVIFIFFGVSFNSCVLCVKIHLFNASTTMITMYRLRRRVFQCLEPWKWSILYGETSNEKNTPLVVWCIPSLPVIPPEVNGVLGMFLGSSHTSSLSVFGSLGYKGLYYPIVWGFLINHYKDPY